jgi:hypothetical protein
VRLLVLGCVLGAGCAAAQPRLAWVSSQATQASWSLVVDDSGGAGQLLVDGRTRNDNCNRVRSRIRCELRGLFPGGHSFELRVAGAVLKRTVLIGHPWPQRVAMVRVRSPEEAEAAGKAGADAVLVSGGETRAIVTAAHAAGTRALVWWDASALDWAGADGIVTGEIPKALHDRFPEGRVFPAPPETTEPAAAALALLSGNAVVPASAFDFLRERRRDKSLRGATATPASGDQPPVHRAFAVGAFKVLQLNFAAEPWGEVPPGGWRLSGPSNERSGGVVQY